MERHIGTVVRGIRTPIIKNGDNLVEIIGDSLGQAIAAEDIQVHDKDIVAITESLLARAQGNFATTSDIAHDIAEKFPGDELGIVFPILSRNRFSMILKGIAQTGKKLHILLSYPADEVGNQLMDETLLFGKDINPYVDTLVESEYRDLFGEEVVHPFTGVDYVTLYKEIAPNSEFYFSNNPATILNYTDNVLVSSIHSRQKDKQLIKSQGGQVVYGLDDILTESIAGSGYNPEYGLLGSNLSSDDVVKLFPRDCQAFVDQVQAKLNEQFGKEMEVMIYGDGAFKDPVGQIWELADPVVSPGFTPGLSGTPSEIKIKYIADNELKNSESDEMVQGIKERIASHKEKAGEGKNTKASIGTTPRQITDLLGSLADLTSGSGDKGTPLVFIQGYFDNYASN